MTYQALQIEDRNNILIVTLNRPKALNALNAQTMTELKHFFENDLPSRENIKGVVLTGAGEKAFAAGADIKELLELKNDEGKILAQRGHDIFFSIERSNIPVVAAVNGFALGAGCELAMSCHLRIAGTNAKFGQPEVNLGLIPGYGGTQRLIQYIGKTKAIELLMTASMINAEEAYRLGLLNYVVEPGEEIDKSIALIEKIASKGPIAIQKIIETVNAYFANCTDGFKEEVNGFGLATKTEDFIEGAGAFVEKRKADFKGK